jgi:hypothetical protein
MNLRFLSFICIVLLLGACRQGDMMNPMPSDLLTKEQMIPLLVDIHLTEASLKLNQATILPKDIKLYYSSAYTPVFKKHKTSPEQFDRSLQWYTRHIDKLDEIYTEVITRLSKLETQIKYNPKSKLTKKIIQPSIIAKKINRPITIEKKIKQKETPVKKNPNLNKSL